MKLPPIFNIYIFTNSQANHPRVKDRKMAVEDNTGIEEKDETVMNKILGIQF
ncbi:hypothetical protein HYC85_018167 [Camellia sinensis]|uniref:Uncharacterized protein n=1 Tax=Camellia sinensis TaxID=4442 RepID=A0A7J7GTU0_CAMSI|nr:hypothetical protein HYC85_018167 [Camellia sinensis]